MLTKLFSDTDMTDAEAVANTINSLEFTTLAQQSVALQCLRDDLNFTIPAMARAMNVPQQTMERFLFGKTMMKPTHVKLLALMLMLRVTEPELFFELFSS